MFKKLTKLSEFITTVLGKKKNPFDISCTKFNSKELLSSSLEIGKCLIENSEVWRFLLPNIIMV